MKANQETYMMLGLGVAIAYFATKPKKATAATKPPGAQQIAAGETNGWKYFTDGTAIGPDGKYYYQGDLVYTPPTI